MSDLVTLMLDRDKLIAVIKAELIKQGAEDEGPNHVGVDWCAFDCAEIADVIIKELGNQK